MAISKARREARSKFDREQTYDLAEATRTVKEISKVKFNPTVDIAIRLGVDPRKSTEWCVVR